MGQGIIEDFVFDRSWYSFASTCSEVERMMLVDAIVRYKLDKKMPDNCVRGLFNKIRPLVDGTTKEVSTISRDRYKEDCEALIEMMKPYVGKYDRDMLNDFYRYWKEPTRGKNPRALYQTKKTWSISGRLATWYKRNLNGNTQSISRKEHANKVAFDSLLEGMAHEMDGSVSDTI